jgi:protein SCO1
MPERTTAPAESIAILDHATPGEVIAAFIDGIKGRPEGRAAELLPFLSERHPVYRDRLAGETVRIRGYAMAAFEQTGMPDRALPYVLESLESEFHPYLVAAAARALRGMRQPHPAIGAYLIKAIHNIWGADKPVSFASYHLEWPQREFSTGLTEIFSTLAGFGASARKVLPDLEHLHQSFADKFSDKARSALADAITAIRDDDREVPSDCCGLPNLLQRAGKQSEPLQLVCVPSDLVIQDQDGLQMKWADFFCEKPSVVAFFYTRCANPRKCTQTILNLAYVGDELERAGLSGKVRLAAITYEPQFDTPAALKSYGNSRRFRFDEDSRMLRVPDDFQQVVHAFELGVNFTGSQVNSHRIEFYLMDTNGKIVSSFVRLQTEPKQVVDAVHALLSPEVSHLPVPGVTPQESQPPADKTKGLFHSGSSIVLGVLMAFFPKCPVCWISYMSVLGITGARSIPYSPWFLPVIIVLLAVNLYFLHWRATARNGRAPFVVSLIGSILLFLSVPYFEQPRWLMIPGIGLLVGGSVLQALSYPAINKMRWFFYELGYRFTRSRRKMVER